VTTTRKTKADERRGKAREAAHVGDVTFGVAHGGSLWVAIAKSDRGVVRVVLGRSRREAVAEMKRAEPDASLNPESLKRELDLMSRYLAGEETHFDAPLDLTRLRLFQRRVLKAARRIGYGQTETYGGLARRVGSRGAARAVGQALARNPLPIMVPCHRVVGGDGSPGGFSGCGGIAVKRYLLELETCVRE